MNKISMKHLLTTASLLCTIYIAAIITGCATDSHTAQGAAQGAATGAVSGAVGGLVSSLVFGGDPVERAAQGAAYGGAMGAIAGGVSGSQKDKKVEQANASAESDLRARIGNDTYMGLEALAKCNHEKAHSQASVAQQSANPDYNLAGLWLDVLSYADAKNETKARELYPSVIERDKKVSTASQAEEKMRMALSELMRIRQEYNLPQVCA